jgi:CDP-diacylglycerol---serine O-phosphatidyltransferase
LNTLGRIGWIVCFVFLACGALRLARFNVQSSIGKASGDFTGLPIPMAAGVIACFMALSTDMAKQTFPVEWMNILAGWLSDELVRIVFLCVAGACLALFMVSNITFRSHKTLIFRGIKPFRLLVVLVVLVGLVAFQPELFGFLFFFLYAISGPIEWIFGWKKALTDEEIFEESYDEEPQA